MAIDFMSAGGAVLDTTTAGAGDIKSGKTAYNGDGELVTGTMVDQGAKTASLAPGGSYTIPAGYHNGEGKVMANSVSLSGNANAGQVLSGYTFYNNNYNSKQTGTMANRGAVSTTVNPGGSYTIPAGYHNGSGKVYGGRSYTTVYLGQQDSPWTGFSYNVKSHYPSIYNKLSRNNFIAIPHKYDGNCGDGSYRNAGNCGDFISYNASTGVVTMNGFGVGTQNQIRMTVMFKLYMIY